MSEVTTNPGSRAARAATWSGVGSLVAGAGAIATFFCCVPVVAGAAGGLAALSSFAWVARPWLLGAAGLILGVGFWFAYRPEPCVEGSACALPASRRRARILLWVSTVIALLALTYPQWSSRLYAALL